MSGFVSSIVIVTVYCDEIRIDFSIIFHNIKPVLEILIIDSPNINCTQSIILISSIQMHNLGRHHKIPATSKLLYSLLHIEKEVYYLIGRQSTRDSML